VIAVAVIAVRVAEVWVNELRTWLVERKKKEGLPQRAKKPVTSEYHNRSQITEERKRESERARTLEVAARCQVSRKLLPPK